jgi:hypothetical protein
MRKAVPADHKSARCNDQSPPLMRYSERLFLNTTDDKLDEAMQLSGHSFGKGRIRIVHPSTL